jgi:hypothetical protein
MAASGTTKRISINNILACSPSATLASATISGDLTVDTSTLKVDSTNDRVGIGTATPARPLDIVGSFQSSSGWALVGSPAGLGGTTRYIGGAGGTNSWYFNALTGGNHLWAFGEVEAMRMNSTGLGVGTVAANGIKLASYVTTAGGPASSGTSQSAGSLRIGAASTNGIMDMGTAGSYSWIQAANASNLATNYDLVLNPNGGNVLVGTTSTSGSASNATNLVLGGARTANGNVSALVSTAITIFSITAALRGRYEVVAMVAGSGSVGALSSIATVIWDGSAGRVVANNGTNLTITLSGSDVQITQTSASTQTVFWSFLRIAL